MDDNKLYLCTKCFGRYPYAAHYMHPCEPKANQEEYWARRNEQCAKDERDRLDVLSTNAHLTARDAQLHKPPAYNPTEQDEVLAIFTEMLRSVTKDGGRKRAAGTKPSWKVDPSHFAAIFSHLNKYFHGEDVDPDSGVHPFVHLAWRALAIAYQDTHEGLE